MSRDIESILASTPGDNCKAIVFKGSQADENRSSTISLLSSVHDRTSNASQQQDTLNTLKTVAANNSDSQ